MDRAARDRASTLLRRLANGQFSNDQFEDAMPRSSDPAIYAIFDTAWLYYSDFNEYWLVGSHRLHPDMKRAWIRWILFLDSDLRYEWPPIRHPGADPMAQQGGGLISTVLGLFGKGQPDAASVFDTAGRYPVWSFISAKDYRQALRSPRRLAGRK